MSTYLPSMENFIFCMTLNSFQEFFQLEGPLSSISCRSGVVLTNSCLMASPTGWTWVWVNSGSWWWTGRPGVLRFMGLQRVGHDRATELNWTIITSLRINIPISQGLCFYIVFLYQYFLASIMCGSAVFLWLSWTVLTVSQGFS